MGIMMIPGVALLVGTYGLMVKFHMTNTLYGLALLSAAGGIPGTMFMYVNFVVSIPVALDEAAAIDGAGRPSNVCTDHHAAVKSRYGNENYHVCDWLLEQLSDADVFAAG